MCSVAKSSDFPGKNAGAGYHFLLQGIILTQGSNLLLLSLPLAGGFFTTKPSGKPLISGYYWDISEGVGRQEWSERQGSRHRKGS